METSKCSTGTQCPICQTNMLRIETEVIVPNKHVSELDRESCYLEHLTFDMCSECGHTQEIFKSDNFDMAKVVLAMFYYNLKILNKRLENKA